MHKPLNVIVIGSGFAGLSAAAYLAKDGFKVTVLEKNSAAGGRARQFKADGFTFDMGPSWYWMPDVFEKFFNDFGKSASDYYNLVRVSPSYRVFFKNNQRVDVPSDLIELEKLFESIEPGSSQKLKHFLQEAEYKYGVGMRDLVYKPGRSLLEFADRRVIKSIFNLHLFQSFHQYVRKYFKDERLIQLLEFPVLFLGAQPKNIPALYSLMNYADMVLGTWYPQGGMFEIVKAMVNVTQNLGVEIKLNEEVVRINTINGSIKQVITNHNTYEADVVVGGADYHHIEQHLLQKNDRTYSKKYWNKRVMAPSCLIYYIGINKKVENLLHHNLFFDTDFQDHAKEIYETPSWPKQPLFYVSAPSKTDASVAPNRCENLFVLIPVAPGLKDTPQIREQYFKVVLERLRSVAGIDLEKDIVYKKDYSVSNFINDYNSFKGNAYGLANTLLQTATLKPTIKSKRVKNLFFTGQLTVPGPGVPPSLISGKVTANEIIKSFK